jgi:RNA polymerase sigma-70 factor (ECF subfamily)
MNESICTAEAIVSSPKALTNAVRKPQRRSRNAERLQNLMRDAQAGRHTAYESLLNEVRPMVERLVQSRLGFLSFMDREDIVQEILLSLHAARGTYDPSRPFMPWLVAIAHNRMVDNARRTSRRFNSEVLLDALPAHLADDSAGDPGNEYINGQALRHAIASLPNGQRRALELLTMREMSLKEASALSGMSPSAFRLSTSTPHRRATTGQKLQLRVNPSFD